MEYVREKKDVAAVVGLLAVFIVLYSLWGANLIRQEQQAQSQDSSNSVATNL